MLALALLAVLGRLGGRLGDSLGVDGAHGAGAPFSSANLLGMTRSSQILAFIQSAARYKRCGGGVEADLASWRAMTIGLGLGLRKGVVIRGSALGEIALVQA